jgi:lysophospholipase L1-like esterase
VRRILPLVLAVLLTMSAPAAQAMSLRSEGGGTSQAGDRQHSKALFFGDSYFVGGGCSPDRKADMAWLAGVELGYKPVVRGAGGTGFVAGNPDYDIPPYLAQIHDGALDTRNPRLVVIEGGSNDTGLPLDQIRRNAKKVLQIARKDYPNALLILVGPMDTYGGYADSDPIRDVVRKVAKRLHVPFVNPQKWTAGRDDLLCDDYVHPTYEGHVHLGHRLAAALKRRGA